MGNTSCSVTTGTSSTVTVVATGTGAILFQFDCGDSYYLGVMPIPSGGAKCQTWFKGNQYYGGFQYARLDGAALTVVNVVNIEDYVKGVIPYEMSNTWPAEALKAQAVCARSFAANAVGRYGNYGFDLTNGTDSQVYAGINSANAATDAAVDATAGQYVLYNGQPCEAVYASSDGGATENSENVWSQALPYLRGVPDTYEAAAAANIPGYKWTVSYTQGDLAARLNSEGYSCATITSAAASVSPTGNVISVTLSDSNGKTVTIKGDAMRSVLGVNSLRFAVNAPAPSGANNASTSAPLNGKFTFSGSGVGHNVGMSQWGAYAMASSYNKTYQDIIAFYFTGTTIGAIGSGGSGSTSSAPVFTTNPADQATQAGQSVSFSAYASGSPAPDMQWRMSADGGVTWTDISGATGSVLTLSGVTADMNGQQYRCAATNSGGTAYSGAAVLRVGQSGVYIVSYNSGGGNSVGSEIIVAGGAARQPSDPAKDGCTFAGWYTDSTLSAAYDFTASVTANITLYAKWTANPVAPDWQNPFTDVKTTDWFYSDVAYVASKGLMSGTGAAAFSPNMPLSRGMAVTVLYRMSGSPDVGGLANPFTDVPGGRYYTDAVKWALSNGIVSGYSATRFGPDDYITREQMAVILLHYENYSGSTPPDILDPRAFPDGAKISSYARDAVSNLTMQGIITGRTDGTFDPAGQAARAEFAAILHRFANAAGK